MRIDRWFVSGHFGGKMAFMKRLQQELEERGYDVYSIDTRTNNSSGSVGYHKDRKEQLMQRTPDFGWSLPPGVTDQMIEDSFSVEEPDEDDHVRIPFFKSVSSAFESEMLTEPTFHSQFEALAFIWERMNWLKVAVFDGMRHDDVIEWEDRIHTELVRLCAIALKFDYLSNGDAIQRDADERSVSMQEPEYLFREDHPNLPSMPLIRRDYPALPTVQDPNVFVLCQVCGRSKAVHTQLVADLSMQTCASPMCGQTALSAMESQINGRRICENCLENQATFRVLVGSVEHTICSAIACTTWLTEVATLKHCEMRIVAMGEQLYPTNVLVGAVVDVEDGSKCDMCHVWTATQSVRVDGVVEAKVCSKSKCMDAFEATVKDPFAKVMFEDLTGTTK